MNISTKKLAFVFLFVAVAQFAKAQVKIGDNPTVINKGSILELESNNKGLLFPRVQLTNTTTWSLSNGSNPAAGMVVYNTTSISAGFTGTTDYPVIQPDGTGLYYWDGAGWVAAKGVQGKSITNGTTAPSNANGNNGDTYINTSTGDVYTKIGGVWNITGNIYSIKKQNEHWSSPVPFKYNNVEKWSVGDPHLNKDGNTLYFISNQPGGKGGTDIYVCTRNTEGYWGEAINLIDINTAGDERTPSIGEDGFFYFSSDGGIGMGGLDIYRAKLTGNQLSSIQNMAYPINSAQDDFAFNAIGKLNGYFSSNREGGLGSDDIYSYLTKEKPVQKPIEKPIEKPVYSIAGQVMGKESKLPLKDALVRLTNSNGQQVTTQTNSVGYFEFSTTEKSDYTLVGEKTGFIKDVSQITTKGLAHTLQLKHNLYLSEIVIGKAIRVDNILYDFNKADIRPDAAIELDKLVLTLKENQNIYIELGSHTDSRGNDDYNLKLSQSRANSAVNYIINKGISKERIVAKGYGETRLINKCINMAKCSDEEHQLNRRTEFKIIKQ